MDKKAIEDIQMFALKVVTYKWDSSYDKLLELAELKTHVVKMCGVHTCLVLCATVYSMLSYCIRYFKHLVARAI